MDQLKGSLRFVPLPAITQFIASLGSTGRLQLSQGSWSGDIALKDGQIVAAQLGADRDRAALEGMVLALTEADFAFVDATVEPADAPLLPRDQITTCMAPLVAERERLHITPTTLTSVPCLIDQTQADTETSQVTMQAAALQLLPALVHGHSVEQIAQRRGLARTLRELAMLQAGGLVRLEAAPARPMSQSATEAAARHAGHVPAGVAARMAAPIRPLRPVPTEPQPAPPAPAPRRRGQWWQAPSAAATAQAQATIVDLPRPRLVTDDSRAPRLEAVRNESEHNAPQPARLDAVGKEPDADTEAEAPITAETTDAQARTWRNTLLGFFVAVQP